MIEIDRCPLGYYCDAMVGCAVSECPNLDTCLTLRPYCALEFPTYAPSEIDDSSPEAVARETENLPQQWDEVDGPNFYGWDACADDLLDQFAQKLEVEE